MRILKENFEAALLIAIREQEREQEQAGKGKSSFAAGLREVLKASEAGERITVEEK